MPRDQDQARDDAIDDMAAHMRAAIYFGEAGQFAASDGLDQPTATQFQTRALLAIAKWLQTVGIPMTAITAGSGFAWKTPTLALFEERFESFPAHLWFGSTCDLTALSAFELFGDRFRKLSCYKEYLGAIGHIDLEQIWFAMIFSGQSGGRDRSLFVLHNRQVSEEYLQADDKHDTKIFRRFAGKELSLVLEPLSSFLRSTGQIWYEHLIP